MKVFISWSGSLSENLGEALRNWTPSVIQVIEPYFTPSDVDKGARWSSEIAGELEKSEIGLLCITRENIHSDWILFEAGAISKQMGETHVCPILFDVKTTDLAGPLKQYQATKFEKSDFHKLLNLMNDRLGESKLTPKTLDNVFNKWWPDLESDVEAILSDSNPEPEEPIRQDRDLLEEILILTRHQISMRGRPIPAAVVLDLLDNHIALHNQQAEQDGNYQDTLELLKAMRDPIFKILQHAKSSDEAKASFETYRELTYEVLSKPDKDEFEDDIPF